jgi:hypothetical protein
VGWQDPAAASARSGLARPRTDMSDDIRERERERKRDREKQYIYIYTIGQMH